MEGRVTGAAVEEHARLTPSLISQHQYRGACHLGSSCDYARTLSQKSAPHLVAQQYFSGIRFNDAPNFFRVHSEAT
ncbi:hypothetical protein NDU88_008068 [Pleurodeles waltl]|uniref:Uncharacterized protein n=1 Tax=Pleurodeles waltl TaxID=8319 RepID=A0AAV7QTL9_PLEWA|nr:hypothetical protein NDU88_008068 [Pleurodeles waltl]